MARSGRWVLGAGLVGAVLTLGGCPEEKDPGDASDFAPSSSSGDDDDGRRPGGASSGSGEVDPARAAEVERSRQAVTELFERLRSARSAGDDKAFFALLTPEKQEERLVKVHFACSSKADNDMRQAELRRILGIYGADLTETQAEKRIAPVSDRAGLYAELLGFLRKIARVNRYQYVSLGEIKVDGDRAAAEMVARDEQGQESSRPVEFRRVGGTWRLHL